jgi:hypothetical protein
VLDRGSTPPPPAKKEADPSDISVEARAERLVELLSNADTTAPDQKLVRELASSLRNETAAAKDAGSKQEIDGGATAAAAVFDPLLGNYNVSCAFPPEDKLDDRPVGGKWGRSPLFSIRQSYQHLVGPAAPGTAAREDGGAAAAEAPVVAQAVNVIVVRCLLWTVHVILRGDARALSGDERDRIAQERRGTAPGGGPLSERTVRADFDPPRIVVTREGPSAAPRQVAKKALLSASLGPRSSVVLDTPYCDSRVRIGRGSKGSLFVFSRLDPSSAAFAESDRWRELLQIRPVGKLPLLAAFGGVAVAALGASLTLFASGIRAWNRLWSIPLGLVASLFTLGIAFSSGGIENDRRSVQKARRRTER